MHTHPQQGLIAPALLLSRDSPAPLPFPLQGAFSPTCYFMKHTGREKRAKRDKSEITQRASSVQQAQEFHSWSDLFPVLQVPLFFQPH